MGDKVIMDKEVFVRIADIIRFKQDHENLLSLFDILGSLEDNLYVFVDEAGNELYGTLVGQKVIADATAEDIRLGKTAITENGLIKGTKEMLAYTYAIIDETGCCYEVRNTSMNCDNKSDFVSISNTDDDYLGKYYSVLNGKWYLDSSFSTEWIPK